MANLLTVARVLLIFVVVAVWARDSGVSGWWLNLLMVPLLAWAIFMDALDGWAARRFNEESEAGALFDIAGDRIVELVLWTFFAIRRDPFGVALVPFWVPIVIITRTVLTDFIRSVAFGSGRTPFGPNSMQNSAWARQLTTSRWSRALYGGLKAVCFCALGLLLAWQGITHSPITAGEFRAVVDLLVYATTFFALLRAVPVIWDGRQYILTLSARSATASGTPSAPKVR
ncbi:MAG: CDP-alcohol phosphatidyltransferase family protein [Gemmatimonadota bacterium]|nr:CDP-alcohol phosphatidyltransferase family protein [Gemmatimonadota bacterium]